ncbi:MAG: nitrous oxide-stimulated promoter family protein [Proteobacteria bacterium]|nr:nitrous oxide-stimulated promoter family protein [Pseudomonadota bacterium]MBU1710723.1 nitrous oxide-stimulated promoter family protein [Pseudomonadota bacterium]
MENNTPLHPRMNRERKTVELMLKLYCRDHHKTKQELCTECQKLAEYVKLRLKNCPFQENKTTCGNCPIHCYKPEMRQKIREVMRYAGPRMIRHHPLLAFGHMLDGFRKNPGPGKLK